MSLELMTIFILGRRLRKRKKFSRTHKTKEVADFKLNHNVAF